MTVPVWIRPAAVFQFHRHSLAEFGGTRGIRDQGLAAAYTAGLNQNHGFVDGNKRTAFEQAEVIAAMLLLAEHTLDEAGYAQWLREHSAKIAAPEC